MREWRGSEIKMGDMFRLTGEFESRLGHGWARGRLKLGDIIVALEHAGDCFHKYILLDHSEIMVNGVKKLRLEPIHEPFGAYMVGESMGSLDRAKFGLILAGQTVDIDMPKMPNIYIETEYRHLDRNVRFEALSSVPGFYTTAESEPSDWRSHVGSSVAVIWDTLPDHVRLAIADDAHERASRGKYV